MIIYRSPKEIEKIRKSCELVAKTVKHLLPMVESGVSTADLDRAAEAYIRRGGGKPAFKVYRGFPATLCTSINAEVVHGIPSKTRKLKDGDIIGIDCGAIVDGYYGDHAMTIAVGTISAAGKKLLDMTREALEVGIAQAKVGNRLSDISHAIQAYGESHGYGVVKAFVGHGIGTALHEEPQVPNFGPPGRGPRLREGMVLALEPMLNVGTSDVSILSDNWTVVTADGELSAHFEHTVAVSENGGIVLSQL
ncbi:type I methionyl aminopeptidase [Candidatus Entotheonella palauensis]|uniref:type I methionyl aminopeptidase n=1 Tax=Candidatus Entotheonella palauensis TaxID=93172 RepID=UPI000B7E25E1|nr:type I methionyl aminopeptidase [Candidatus Entotheonella palauensis]